MSKPMTDAERADMYRRQLGGTNAALRRARQEIEELRALVRDMWPFVMADGPSDDFEERMGKLGVL